MAGHIAWLSRLFLFVDRPCIFPIKSTLAFLFGDSAKIINKTVSTFLFLLIIIYLNNPYNIPQGNKAS